MTSSGATGYGPAEFHGAYSLPITATAAQTITIVDAYDDSTIASDLNYYDSYYGLPACTTSNGCFQKLNQYGQAYNYPSKNSGWALEISLDVETAHEICQSCKIVLIEASSSSISNLDAAENEAVALGATEISNSWGGGEYSSETADQTFNHPGIAITVSSGDNGYGSFGYPAASPYVVAVGGTTLNLASGNTYGSETAWNGSGSGCSSYEAAQSWQTSLSNWNLTGCGTNRGVADVAADADPNTGAAVYDSTRYEGQKGWFQVGGTSLGSPLVAAVFALAGGTSTVSYAAQLPYGNPSALHDVTSGSTGSCGTIMCTAGTGYDGPTGLGTPNGLGAF
jgi:subtilase family serine protease